MRLTNLALAGVCAMMVMPFGQPLLAQTAIEQPEGPWAHRGTGTEFPAALGDYSRASITEFSEDGHDASVGYLLRSKTGVLSVNFYVYPNSGDESCDGHFTSVANAIEQYDGTKLLDKSTASAPDGSQPGSAITARYLIPAGAMREDVPELVSDAYLYCSQGPDWYVKYRASWNGTADSFPDTSALMRAINWPDVVIGD